MAVENHTDVYFEHRSLEQITGDLSELLMRRHLHLTTAESCTGGKLASALCAADNTPEWFGIGFVTFNDDAKAHILGVSRETLAEHTAVSEAVAREMAEGARQRAEQDIAISITGYGGTTGKTARLLVQSGLAGALTIAPKPQLNALAASVKRYWTRP